MRWPLLQQRRSWARTFTNRPSGWGVDQAAVAPPLSFRSANARVSLRTSGGGGGTPAPGVLNCSMLLPLVTRPLLSTPTTVTLYCGATTTQGHHTVSAASPPLPVTCIAHQGVGREAREDASGRGAVEHQRLAAGAVCPLDGEDVLRPGSTTDTRAMSIGLARATRAPVSRAPYTGSPTHSRKVAVGQRGRVGCAPGGTKRPRGRQPHSGRGRRELQPVLSHDLLARLGDPHDRHIVLHTDRACPVIDVLFA